MEQLTQLKSGSRCHPHIGAILFLCTGLVACQGHGEHALDNLNTPAPDIMSKKALDDQSHRVADQLDLNESNRSSNHQHAHDLDDSGPHNHAVIAAAFARPRHLLRATPFKIGDLSSARLGTMPGAIDRPNGRSWNNSPPPAIPGGHINADGVGDSTPRDDADPAFNGPESEPPQNGPWVHLTGHVFYNDRRKSGDFSGRKDYYGQDGRDCGRDGVRDDGSSCDRNLLGALHAVVDVFERDTNWLASVRCKRREKLGSAVVGPDGRFSLYVRHGDDCNRDDWERTALALRVRLRYCNADDVCFSMGSGRNDEYALYHPGASYADPLTVRRNSSYDVGPMVFAPHGQNQTLAEDYAIAANYFASLVDTMKKIHGEHDVPFYYNQYGEVGYIYPSNRTSSATTRGPDEVIIKGKDNWIKGPVVSHEYGHVLHLRAWDGDDYGWNGIGASWNPNRQQHARVAFKEGFAGFITRVVHGDGMRCDGNFDPNDHHALLGDPNEGETWVKNVSKMFCDWHDQANDDDPSIAGSGDHFSASLASIQYNLKNMWVYSDEYGGDRREGLGMCDYIDYYLDIRKSPRAVGLHRHNQYVSSIADLSYQNHVHCDLAEPSDH